MLEVTVAQRRLIILRGYSSTVEVNYPCFFLEVTVAQWRLIIHAFPFSLNFPILMAFKWKIILVSPKQQLMQTFPLFFVLMCLDNWHFCCLCYEQYTKFWVLDTMNFRYSYVASFLHTKYSLCLMMDDWYTQTIVPCTIWPGWSGFANK